jgi:O-antigen/teichoic acid export membrane protein
MELMESTLETDPQPMFALESETRTNAWAVRRRWILKWTGRVAEFGFVQIWVQVLGAVAGILIVRSLAKEQYALYAITNQMQSACNLLADLGIGIGVRSIGGRVWQDRRRFGELVTTALDMRRWFAVFSLAGCLPVAAWMLAANGATWSTVTVMCGILVASVLPLLSSSVYLVVPQLHGEYRRIQKLDLGNAALRLALVSGLAATRLNAALAAAVGSVVNWVQEAWLRRWSSERLDFTAQSNAEDRRELTSLSARAFPNTLFFCFQGQVTLLILTLVGNSTGIADVTALGRLALLLTIFTVTFTHVLVPRFTRCQDSRQLGRLYVWLVGATGLTLAPVVIAGWLFPRPLLWVLGEKYAALEGPCGWFVTFACVQQMGTVLWLLNSSRAWIWLGSVLWIPLTLAVQAALPFVLDLRQLTDIVKFQLISAAVPLPLLAGDAWMGIRRQPQSGSR